MSSAMQTTLFAILGTGLAILSVTCLMLWRKLRALSRLDRSWPTASPRVDPPPRVRPEVGRRLDELAGWPGSRESRLARIEASAAEAAMTMAMASKGVRRSDPGVSAGSGGPTLIAVPNLSSPPSVAIEAAAELDRRFGDVWAMSEGGMPAEAIARETGHPIGQVELILGLRRRLPAVEAGPDA